MSLMQLPLLTTVAAEAADGAASSFDVNAVLTEAVTSVQGQLLGTLAIVVPAMVAVTAAVVAVQFGFKWLRKLGKG